MFLSALALAALSLHEAGCGAPARHHSSSGDGGSGGDATGAGGAGGSMSGAGGKASTGSLSGAGGMTGAGGGMAGTGGMTGAGGMTSASSANSSAGVGGMPGGPVPVGAECLTDANCGSGFCMKPSADDPVLGGGPAGGYCSKTCLADADCPGVGSLCIMDANGNGSCFLGCSPGPDLQFLDDPLDPSKCYGREDVACLSIMNGDVCLPTCGNDSQCPGARVCDPSLGVCVTSPSTGLPTGDACDPMADPSECAGLCLSFTGADPNMPVTSCSTRCVLGGQLDGDDCGGLTQGLCAFSAAGSGPGDAGFCTEACSAHSDCQNPNFWCFSVGFAQNGYCFGSDACPNGQNDCTNPNTTCTDTPYGKYCIDTSIPQ